MKITIVGAGNVGGTCASFIAAKNIVTKILLLDISKEKAMGKALDIWNSSQLLTNNTKVIGLGNKEYIKTKNSKICIITSGFIRNTGMTRDQLITKNAVIIKEVTNKLLKYSKNALFIIVSNPLDIMTYVAFKELNISRFKIFGMSGLLDTARYNSYLATALKCNPKDIQSMLIGEHGDTMIPLLRYTTVSGIPIGELLSKSNINFIIQKTKKTGGEILNMLKTSAWYTPGIAIANMVEAIIKNSKNIITCSCYLTGEYGLNNVFLGVPVILGKNGIEKILELQLNKEERKNLKTSSLKIKKMISQLLEE
ncbi:malate dehydrogenase [Candidatus Karelsulcia muelleri]|nr:malate dehydrogenase [Candidatus Karelsulcia muelleri]WDI79538.1 malate dehydrogenase [Candidatus Karelsulcia muelleri]WDR78995.1 malate dehydrogenase [Candidatus Karelsulcia muelleri]